MTYRQKLLLKRFLIFLGVLIVVVFLVLLIGFSYLGRFVIYTEEGARFSFNDPDTASSELVSDAPVAGPEQPVLIIGDSIMEDPTLSDEDTIILEDHEINGLIVDYDTLVDGSTLNAIEFSENNYNTLMLEMRVEGSEILNNEPVLTLIKRAKNANVKLVAMISCLDDSAYALETTKALPIEGGALWVSAEGTYWLDPTDEDIQDYITYMIMTLGEMGFDEVVLNNFYFPESTYIDFYDENYSRGELLLQSYQKIAEAVDSSITLGLFISDNTEGHQAFEAADHLYVYMKNGSYADDYLAKYPDRYIVFITESHDTRFENHGRILAERDAGFIPEPEDEEE